MKRCVVKNLVSKAFLSLALISSLCNNAFAVKMFKKSDEPVEITQSAKTGFMMGVNVGTRIVNMNNQGNLMQTWGFALGYILYFSKEFGIRLKGDYNYGALRLVSNSTSSTNSTTNSNQTSILQGSHEFLFNLDFLYDFYNDSVKGLSLGVFAGGGAGYLIQANVSRGGPQVVLNAGFNTTFENKHRLDLTYSYTIITPNQNSTPISIPFMFNLGYSYVF